MSTEQVVGGVPTTLSDPYSFAALDAEYKRLCVQRDAIEAKAAPLRARLAAAAKEAETYRVKAMAVAAELDAVFAAELYTGAGLGKRAFIALKNRLGSIAKLRQQMKDKGAK
jgi:hypothetical protein